MTIAVRNMEVDQELPPVRKEMTFDDMRLFSMWGNRNIHTDWEVAKKSGLMSHAYLSEMLTIFFGKNWLQGGKLSLSFLQYTLPGDVITARGRIREKVDEGSAIRFDCEVWCESLNGEKTVVGTASGLVD